MSLVTLVYENHLLEHGSHLDVFWDAVTEPECVLLLLKFYQCFLVLADSLAY